MRQHFVFADQRRGGDLRHHESGIQAGAGSQKWRQAFVQRRVHQALQPALGNSRQRAERDGQEIQDESQRLAMEISAGDDVSFSLRSFAPLDGRAPVPDVALHEHQRIVHRRVDFDLHHLAAVGQRVAHRAVDLRHAAQGVGILHAVAVAMRLAQLAAFEHLAQIRCRLQLAAVRTRL